jgi:hypothetical protein
VAVEIQVSRTFGVAAPMAAIGIGLALTAPAHAGDGSIGAGLVGFGIGAILGSILTPTEVYYLPPPPPEYYDPVDYGPPPTPPKQHNRSSSIPRTHLHGIADDRQTRPTAPTKMAKATLGSNAAQKAEVKFRAAQAKAKRDGVQNLTQKDIEGLSREQLKQLRGY